MPRAISEFPPRRAAHRRPSPQRRATAAVELAVCLPFLLILVVGTLEIGRLLQTKQILDSAAREGARQAASGQMTNAQVQTVVVEYLKQAGLPTSNAVATVADLTAPGTDAKVAAEFDQLQVTVSVPYADLRWINTNMFVSPTLAATGQAVWPSMNNKSYPTGVVVPPGS